MPSIVAGTQCDPENFTTRSEADRALINAAYAGEPRLDEIRLVLGTPAATVRQKVMAAMLACKIPIAEAGDGVIEARYGEETGLIGQYSLTTHVAVVALDDSTTLVRLSGRETSKRGRVLNPTIDTQAVTNKNSGRSGQAWVALRNAAKQLRADASLNVDFEKSTPLAVVYSR